MIDPTPFIRSYVPGRLRLRHPGLIGLEGETLEALTSTVKSAPGITGCTVNPKVGSLLLTWAAEKLTQEDLLEYLQFWAAFLPEDAQGGTSHSEKQAPCGALTETILTRMQDILACKGSAAKCRRQMENRLTALFGVATMASLLKGASLHAQIGTVFAAMLVWHLWKRRRVF